jgi:LmbE family N-acetylglucosaminyl deacetylase
MMTAISSTKNSSSLKRLLAVLAHPDDESFGPGGTLALYAQRGDEVTLICATRGEVGSLPAEMEGKVDDIAALREHELRCAAEILGLKDVIFLGYRDSGMPGSSDNQHPNALCAAPVEEVAEKIEEHIRSIKPQVIITFDPIGGYHHPDHIAIQRATLVAFNSASSENSNFENLPPHQTQKLYYHTFPRRLMKFVVRLLPLFRQDPTSFGRNNDIDLLAITKEDFPVHARINYRAVADIKEAASACHHSQQDPGTHSFLRAIERIVGSKENFMRAYPPARDGLRERDLFEGVTE